MKNILLLLSLLTIIFLSACGEKTDAEKLEDAMNEAKETTKNYLE